MVLCALLQNKVCFFKKAFNSSLHNVKCMLLISIDLSITLNDKQHVSELLNTLIFTLLLSLHTSKYFLERIVY